MTVLDGFRIARREHLQGSVSPGERGALPAMLAEVARRGVIATIATLALAEMLALCPPASALSPGELFAVSGVPGANAFLPGLANDSSLDEGDTNTLFDETDNTRKVSDDGRYVVFASKADGLSQPPTPASSTSSCRTASPAP